MMSFSTSRYNSYKDSHVNWLGDIPSHWNCMRLKDVGTSIIGITYSPEDVLDTSEDGLIVLRSSNIQNGRLDLKDIVCVNININKKQLVRNRDILICSRNGSRALIGKNILIDKNIEGNTFGAFMTIFRSRYNNFIYFILNSKLFESQSGLYMSSTVNQLTINTLNNFLITLPPKGEQDRIAAYLSIKTAIVDRKIDLLNKKAERYKELKLALINETVTFGLNKNYAKKKSDIDWIGEIPEDWTIQRIGTAFEERSEKVNDTEYPPLSVTMKGIVPQLENVAKTDNNDNRKKVCINDFVINSRSDRRGSSGISEYEGSVSVINIVLKPRKHFVGKYLHHLFRSYRFIEEYYRVGRGIVADLWTTRYSVMKAIEFPVPSFEEQKEIADYLDIKTVQIDEIIDSINNQIQKVKELRKTFINDVVTGKIRVVEDGDLS